MFLYSYIPFFVGQFSLVEFTSYIFDTLNDDFQNQDMERSSLQPESLYRSLYQLFDVKITLWL